MNRLRSLWFESRHLEVGAPELRAELAALDDDARTEVLTTGDRLAALSLTLAQQYCRRAPAAWRLGPAAFRHWVARGEALATGREALASGEAAVPEHEAPKDVARARGPHHAAGRDRRSRAAGARTGGSREAAAAYFALAPAALAELPAAEIDLWLALVHRVLGVARRLGEVLVTESGPVLGELDHRAARLTAWVEVGLSLAAAGGWEGELAALHFFEATALALPLFAPADFPMWAELGRAAERLGPGRPEIFASVPAALHRLPETDRSLVLRLADTVATRAPAVGLEVYFSLPAALEVCPDERAALVASLRPVAAHAPATLGDLLPVLRALLAATPAAVRGELIALAGVVADRFPEGVVPFYRVLLRLLEQTGATGIARWVHEGLAVAAANSGAGRAYFGLDSRTSLAVLAAGSTAVAFSEVQGLLKRYLQMLTGRAYAVAARADVGYRPPLVPVADAAADRSEILFPLRVDCFPTSEANLRLYRLIAAQHAGRLAFGTAALTPPISEFLARFEHPAVAEHLLGIFEGIRIDAAVARAYRGLAVDLRAVASELGLAGLRLPGTLEHLARVLTEARRTDIVRRLPAVAERLVAPDATVAESAQVTVFVYAEIMRGAHGLGLTAGTSGFPELFAGETPNEALFDLDSGFGPFGMGEARPEEGGETEDDAPRPLDEDARAELALAPEIDEGTPGAALDPALLLELLQRGGDLLVKQGSAEDLEALGLYISDLAGKLPRERLAELQGKLRQAHAGATARPEPPRGEAEFFYDEWDYQIGDYRSAWCRLTEIALESDTGDFFHRTLAAHGDLLPEIRRQFQRIRPERYRVVHGLEDGEDFDLDAVITWCADRRSGHAPSPKLYQARQREERDVATLFLLDMSASTDEPVPGASEGRRVIDIIREALVVMTEALEGIGDAYGIYGFSGHGRGQVEFYLVKHFSEPLTATVKGRIGAVEPKRSTRMGAALRHAVAKMRAVTARSRHILLLSDGFPQDVDYGDDRRSNVYGIQDTMMAFQEASRAGVTPFCITVDKAGHDYLKQICDASRYLVIDDITALPRELPKIYQRCVRP